MYGALAANDLCALLIMLVHFVVIWPNNNSVTKAWYKITCPAPLTCNFVVSANLTASPRITSLSPVTVSETSSATLSCTALGRPPPSVRWYNASTEITNGGRVTTSNVPFTTPSVVTGLYRVTSSLTISRTVGSDRALYECVASTAKPVPHKSATATIDLIVQGKECEVLSQKYHLLQTGRLEGGHETCLNIS